MSFKRYSGKQPLKKGPGGRNLCRCGCLRECQPPRRTFASQACVDAYLLRTDGRYIRRQVRKRDKGICAVCKLDCPKLRVELKLAIRSGDKQSASELKKRYPRLSTRKSYWEAHHILPVADGGGEAQTLDQFQTLCIPCHQIVTNLWRKTRT